MHTKLENTSIPVRIKYPLSSNLEKRRKKWNPASVQLWQKKCLMTPIYMTSVMISFGMPSHAEMLWYCLLMSSPESLSLPQNKCKNLFYRTELRFCTEIVQCKPSNSSTGILLQRSEPPSLISNKHMKYKKKVSIFHSNTTDYRTIPSSVITFGILLYPWNSLL